MSFNIFLNVTQILVHNISALYSLPKEILMFMRVTREGYLKHKKSRPPQRFLFGWTGMGPRKKYFLIFFQLGLGAIELAKLEFFFL